jgi:APA family basic amino acid/polyamine antiporter
LPVTSPASASGALHRVLGSAFGLAIVVGGVIGVGILRAPGEVAARLPSAGLIIGAWILGGLYALLGANSAAELGAALPSTGGFFVYVRRAFGPFPAFIAGWADFLSSCASATTGALIIGEYSGRIVPALRGGSTALVIALVVLLWFGWLQSRGVKEGDRVQQVTSAIKAILLLALIVACLLGGSRAADTVAPPVMPSGLAFWGALLLALQGIIYAYDGWYFPMYFGEEMANPGREIPRAMIRGILLIILIYVLINVAVLVVLPVGRLAGEPLAVGAAMGVVFGPRGDLIVAAVAILTMPSAMNASLMSGTRTLFALARDGLVRTPFLTRVSATGTPRPALAVTVVLAVAFLMTGTVERLLAVVSFFYVANYVAAFLSVFVLRRREPGLPRPWRAWGHPWSTGIVLAGSLAFLAGSVAGDTRNSVIALVSIIASVPLFYLFRAPAPATSPPPPRE